MSNEELKAKYEDMHKQGVSAWFSDGNEERETILKMGEPWADVRVFEIGCGEGDLAYRMSRAGATVIGVDYSPEAITKALAKYPETERLQFFVGTYKSYGIVTDRIVMQGVLEHLDDPFGELKGMIDRFKPKTVITSSPCFLNPRGIVWMTLDMLGAVMSKTDLHFIDPGYMSGFCDEGLYDLKMESCDYNWGNEEQMILDLKQRIPLALKDGKIPYDAEKLDDFLNWLENPQCVGHGATMVYRIDI